MDDNLASNIVDFLKEEPTWSEVSKTYDLNCLEIDEKGIITLAPNTKADTLVRLMFETFVYCSAVMGLGVLKKITIPKGTRVYDNDLENYLLYKKQCFDENTEVNILDVELKIFNGEAVIASQISTGNGVRWIIMTDTIKP